MLNLQSFFVHNTCAALDSVDRASCQKLLLLRGREVEASRIDAAGDRCTYTACMKCHYCITSCLHKSLTPTLQSSGNKIWFLLGRGAAIAMFFKSFTDCQNLEQVNKHLIKSMGQESLYFKRPTKKPVRRDTCKQHFFTTSRGCMYDLTNSFLCAVHQGYIHECQSWSHAYYHRYYNTLYMNIRTWYLAWVCFSQCRVHAMPLLISMSILTSVHIIMWTRLQAFCFTLQGLLCKRKWHCMGERINLYAHSSSSIVLP